VLAPGQSVVVDSGLSVRFVNVVGDSRCPGDALCIAGGDAIVRIDITVGGVNAARDLHTGTMQPVTHQGVRVELVSLDPYPFASRPFHPSEYRATLRVVR
jgi:hypothetical protein